MSRFKAHDTCCPVARTLEHAGDAWSLLILRDAAQGLTRFDQFQKSLGAASNIVADRLARLVASGLLEKRRYNARPPRDEYLLTAMGRDFQPVLTALMAFGNKHLSPQGPASLLVDVETGRAAEPAMVDRLTGRPLDDGGFVFAAGPGADQRLRDRATAMAAARALQGLAA